MHRHLLAACAALLPLSLASVPANADQYRNCWLADELSAAELHNFQTMLMVGALKCRDRAPIALEGYNRFMNSKRDLIVANQYVLMSHFIREYGDSSGMGAFREYETGVGNRHSSADNLTRCDAIGAMSRMAANASEADLRELARVVGQDSLRTTCPDLTQADEGLAPMLEASTADAEPPAFPETEIAANEASEPPADPAADEIAPAIITSSSGTQPKIISVTEPEFAAAADSPSAGAEATDAVETSPTVAEASTVAASATTPTAAQALQEAARALALAATALQAQSASAAPAATPQATSEAAELQEPEPRDPTPETTELVNAPE